MEKEKVLVTGGAGFIGSHVVDRLILEGFDVAVIDDLSTGERGNVNGQVREQGRFYEGSINDRVTEVLEKENPEYVVHNAAQISISRSMKNPSETTFQNAYLSDLLFEQCKSSGVRKVIFPSSSSVYGNAASMPTIESASLSPRNPYAISKAYSEKMLRLIWGNRTSEYQHDFMDFVVLRYGNVYGPRQNPKGEAGVIGVFIDSLLKGKPPMIWGSGNQSRDYVFVEDVAEANVAAIRYSGDHHVFNIATGKDTSVNDVYQMIRQHLIGPKLEEVKHDEKYREQVYRICLDSRLAGQMLDWRPKTSLEEGIKKTIEWYEMTMKG